MATYIVTPVEGDTGGRQTGAHRFKTRAEANAFFKGQRGGKIRHHV